MKTSLSTPFSAAAEFNKKSWFRFNFRFSQLQVFTNFIFQVDLSLNFKAALSWNGETVFFFTVSLNRSNLFVLDLCRYTEHIPP